MSEGGDVELLDAWRGGDEQAGSRLVKRHFPRVYRFFRRRLDQPDVATELTQRTFLTCVETQQKLRDDQRFSAFVIGVAKNHLLRHLRAQATAAARHTRPYTIPASQMSPSGAVALREEQRLLLSALRTLPLDLQLTVELFYWEELTVNEIGGILEVAPGTIKWRLSRARELLREQIAKASDDTVRTSTLDGLDKWAQSLRRVLDPQDDGSGST